MAAVGATLLAAWLTIGGPAAARSECPFTIHPEPAFTARGTGTLPDSLANLLCLERPAPAAGADTLVGIEYADSRDFPDIPALQPVLPGEERAELRGLHPGRWYYRVVYEVRSLGQVVRCAVTDSSYQDPYPPALADSVLVRWLPAGGGPAQTAWLDLGRARGDTVSVTSNALEVGFTFTDRAGVDAVAAFTRAAEGSRWEEAASIDIPSGSECGAGSDSCQVSGTISIALAGDGLHPLFLAALDTAANPARCDTARDGNAGWQLDGSVRYVPPDSTAHFYVLLDTDRPRLLTPAARDTTIHGGEADPLELRFSEPVRPAADGTTWPGNLRLFDDYRDPGHGDTIEVSVAPDTGLTDHLIISRPGRLDPGRYLLQIDRFADASGNANQPQDAGEPENVVIWVYIEPGSDATVRRVTGGADCRYCSIDVPAGALARPAVARIDPLRAGDLPAGAIPEAPGFSVIGGTCWQLLLSSDPGDVQDPVVCDPALLAAGAGSFEVRVGLCEADDRARLLVDQQCLLDRWLLLAASRPVDRALVTTTSGDPAGLYCGATETGGVANVFPNPFQPDRESVTIRFSLPDGANIGDHLAIYDLFGARVRALPVGSLSPGVNEIRWDGRNDRGEIVASGVYQCRLYSESPLIRIAVRR